MARIRTIKPTIWTDQRFVQLSPMARLLAIGMISHADDEGRLFASITRLAGDVFPNDDIKPAQVRVWRQEIADCGLVDLYSVSGVEYAWFPKWKKHQRISKPQGSVLPNPSRNDSAPSSGTVPHPPEEPFPTEPEPVPQTGVSLAGGGAGVTEVEVERREPPLPPKGENPAPRRTRGTGVPDVFLVTDDLRRWARGRGITVDLDRETETFLNHHRSKGNTFKDWNAAWRTWMDNTLKFGGRRDGRPTPTGKNAWATR